jgi:hypothetical protein
MKYPLLFAVEFNGLSSSYNLPLKIYLHIQKLFRVACFGILDPNT